MCSVSPKSSPNDQRIWRGTTTPDRAAGRRQHLLAVAYELLGEKGAAGITVRELYTRARLNPRYFYESFNDLDELLAVIYDQLLTEMTAEIVAAIDAAADNEPAKTRAAIATTIGYLTDDPRRIRILLTDALGHEALTQRRSNLIRTAAALMAAQAAEFYDIPANARLLRSTTHMLAGGLFELLIAWQDRTLNLTVGELIDDASALVSGLGDAARSIAQQRTERRRPEPNRTGNQPH
jgi:AcrR family transcriptional regulator